MATIAIDFGGTFITHEAADKAHEEWFRVMAILLRDESVNDYAGKKDYFVYVYKVMARYTGLNAKNDLDKKLMRKFARNLFQMSYFSVVNKNKEKLLIKDFADYLKELKKKYSIYLVTTTPEDIVIPILEIFDCMDLFDGVCKSPLTSEPDKKELLSEFVAEKGKPKMYIGNSEEDALACEDLDIPFILVKWDKYDREAETLAKHSVDTVEELKPVLETQQ